MFARCRAGISMLMINSVSQLLLVPVWRTAVFTRQVGVIAILKKQHNLPR